MSPLHHSNGGEGDKDAQTCGSFLTASSIFSTAVPLHFWTSFRIVCRAVPLHNLWTAVHRPPFLRLQLHLGCFMLGHSTPYGSHYHQHRQRGLQALALPSATCHFGQLKKQAVHCGRKVLRSTLPHDCLGFTPLSEGKGLGLLTITRQPCHDEYCLQILKAALFQEG